MNYNKLIIGILIGGLLIVGVSIYAGIAARDVEVEDNAYEAGLRYDQTRKREAELGWCVSMPRSIRTGKASIPVDVIDRASAPIRDAAVEVELSRRGGHQARTYRCSGSGDGRYKVAAKFDEPGYWDARVRVTRQGDSLRFEKTMHVQ